MTETNITDVPTGRGSVSAQIASLPTLPMADLWTLWDRYFSLRPKHINRSYLESRLAYRMQEVTYGGVPAGIRRMLVVAGAKHSKTTHRAVPRGRGVQQHLVPGTTLIREWEDREFRVVVTPEGQYDLDCKLFRSLSAVAKHITGTHWNGPRFFGLRETQNTGGGQ